MRKAEAKGGELDTIIAQGTMFEDYLETKHVANLFSNKDFTSDVDEILASYIERHPDLLGTDFSELDINMKLSNILERIVEDSGAFINEDPSQLNIWNDTNEFPTDEMNHCIK